MSSNNKKNKISFNNFLSFCIIIVFIICECLYFNIIFKTDFKFKIDNLPNNVKDFISYSLKNFKVLNDNQINNNDSSNSDTNIDVIDSSNQDKEMQELVIEENTPTNNDLLNSEEDTKNDEDSSKNDEISFTDDTNTNQIIDIPIKNKKLKCITADLNYFNNALFIGDSRMAGFEIYMKLPGASYFCYSSASVFNIFDKEDNVDGYGNIKLLDLLSKHKFDKIYIMLGINNLQTNFYNHKVKYKEMLDYISILQPNAIIYLIANFHITDIEDATKPFLNNKNIDDVNNFIKDFADNVQIFYLDANPMYDDENGNLKLELSTDNIHIHIVHYDKFLVYLLSNALVEDDS